MIDFHNHVVPGVDDGAADLEQARAALAALAGQGVHTLVATPHARASMALRPAELEAFGARIGAAWEALRELASAEFPGLRLERGAEVMLDVPGADLSDPRLRLAGTAFALVEFPYMQAPPNAAQALAALAASGCRPVLAHPERYPGSGAAAAEEWRNAGALLQLNAGEQASLLLEGNAALLLRGQPPLPVAPLGEPPRRSFFGRLFTRGR
jgi:protein-tyrosine phosphatase